MPTMATGAGVLKMACNVAPAALICELWWGHMLFLVQPLATSVYCRAKTYKTNHGSHHSSGLLLFDSGDRATIVGSSNGQRSSVKPTAQAESSCIEAEFWYKCA